jgi:hypothetical protein
VPKEAVQLDFVFSNVMSGEGLYDNRGGFDYHLPIEKGTGTVAVSVFPAGLVVVVGCFEYVARREGRGV